MIRCSAELFKIVNAFASTEVTRYYLNGVYVEPHNAGGVTLVATDGHRLFCLYDKDGHADESVIVRLTPAALKECKVGKGETRRDVVLRTGEKFATVCAVYVSEDSSTDSPIVMSHDCRVDGTYPEYRRIIPTISYSEDSRPGQFNAAYIASFSDASIALAKTRGKGAMVAIRVLATDVHSPALVMFGTEDRAFGVIMPIRMKDIQVETVPEWFNTCTVAMAAAE